MNIQQEKQNNLYAYSWFFLFAVCSLLYQQIQDNYRPNYKGENETIQYLLGIAPNFLPAIGLPALFLILIPYLSSKKTKSLWFHKLKYLTAIFITLTGLILWEVIQAILPKARFDWNDILWTIIGSSVFYFIWRIVPESFKQDQEKEV